MQLSDELLHECQGLLYRKWAEASDVLKHVKAEKPDAHEPDWTLMHAERLRRADNEKNRLFGLLNELNMVAPLTRARAAAKL